MKVLINGKASAIASDHLWSMVRQSMASKCVYTRATSGVPIHIYLSVPGVWKQYTGLHNWTSPCFVYVHGSSLLIFLKRHLLRFLLRFLIFRLKVEKKALILIKYVTSNKHHWAYFKKSNPLLRNEAKMGYQYNYICLPANKYVN